jgi:thiamine biosynthesis protein ThiS
LTSIVVNGKDEALQEGDTVSALLERLGLGARYALVERNGEPVERSRYSEVRLEDGDRLVVARPVAGG